ncbi:probable salivary secreted peptide [Plodia interpunctella]|uniref:probable salivary secreted peptide n=1 Tax=Plodia interpunctella TaxID=58824 RepID=UPI0023678F99|nr:probable salivary secreted peptide [Plodia interpunctella]
MMKATLLLAVLAVLGAQSAVVKAPVEIKEPVVAKATPALRYNLNLGYVSAGDRLLYRQYLYQPAIANAIQSQDFIYRGNATTRISAIQVNEVGYTQYAIPSLISGGLNRNNVTIRITSARGYGYYYLIDIWGR